MKNFMTKLNLWVVMLSVWSLLYSCSQEGLEKVSKETNTGFTVRAVKGYLEFRDQKALEEVKAQLEGKSREELDAWESQFDGFTSLRSLDEQSMDEQEKWFEELGKMSEEDRNLLAAVDDDFWYSDFIKPHASAFILEDSGIYRLNTNATGLANFSFVNKEGIIKINGKIYQHRLRQMKVIEDGDDSKINILPRILENDLDQNVLVYNLNEKTITLGNNAKMEFDSNYTNGPFVCYGNTVDDYRVKGIITEGHLPGAVFNKPSN